jgi:predicted AlkP superfamily pyrophosphatase or phosphodiesterase
MAVVLGPALPGRGHRVALADAGGPSLQRPKLVVLLSVDQMRADYIDDYGAHWRRGLRTLLGGGAHFRKARFPFLGTVTCPGHVTLATGAYPHRHGMILNTWWDRAQAKVIECTSDPGSPLVPYGESSSSEGDSAARILIPTLADEMKVQLSPPPRVVSFSYKARSAIGLVGKKPDSVTWYEGGAWVTSRAFANVPDPVIAGLVKSNPIDAVLGRPWDRLLPAAAYKNRDDAPEESPPSARWTRTFPKPLQVEPGSAGGGSHRGNRYSLWEKSPFPDESLGRFARGALSELKLGQGAGTDLLAVSFSALDVVGHAYGPRSHEVQDVLARLDLVLGDLLDALDQHLGRDRYVVALSSDHGVAAYPEQLKAEGHNAGRIPMDSLRAKLEAAITAEIGPGKHVANISYTDVYLSPGLFARLRSRAGAIERVLGAIRDVPGLAALFSTDDLRRAQRSGDPLRRAAALSHFPGRSGDIILVPSPNWLTTRMGTTHGSQNDYDQHVPVIFYGAGIKPGKYDGPASPADVAPTLARLVGIKLRKAEGQPLHPALAVPLKGGGARTSRVVGQTRPAGR